MRAIALMLMPMLMPMLMLATTATQARGQICRGFPSTRKAPISVGAGAAVTGEWHGAGASVGLGLANGVFTSVGTGFDHNSFLKDKYVVLSGGYDKTIGAAKKMSICPVVAAGHLFGPNYPYYDGVTTGEWRTSVNTASAGVSFGRAYALDDAINLLAFARAEVSYVSQHNTFAGTSSMLKQTYESLTVGAGFSIIERYTIQPWFSFPFGLKDAEMGAGLGVRVGFPRK